MKTKKIVKTVLKILLVIILVLAVVIACGFAYLYTHGMSGMSHTTEAAQGQIRVACVGDSITYGHGTTGWPKNTYPAVLQSLLGDGYHVNNYGVSSQAVQDTSDRRYTDLAHYQESLDYDADILVFMMGTNDSKPVNWIDGESFKEDLLALLDSYGDTEIYLCTPAASFFLEGQTEGVTNHNIQPLVVEELAGIIREVAAERGYTLVDVHALTVLHPEWFEADGVHPSNDGAAAIAALIAETITG